MDIQKMHTESDVIQPTQGTTFFRTCLNAGNALCGVGIISVPYALSKGGWVGILLLLLVAALCLYTSFILHKCMDTNPNIKSYPDIGQLAFGRKGVIMISIFLYLELFLVAVEFLLMEADNLHKILPKRNFNIFGIKIEGEKGIIILSALIVLPTTWLQNLKVLAYVSATGILSSFILVSSMLWCGAFDGIGFHESGELYNRRGITTTISVFTFCYCGHAVFPTIRNSMKKKTQFPMVLVVYFTLCTTMYGLASISGYLMFGEQLASQVTLNMPVKNKSSKVAIFTTLIIPITKYAMIIMPIATELEKTFPFQDSKIRSFLIRTSLVMSTLVVALVVPLFGHIMAFIGAFVGVMLSILFPMLCYWKIVVGFRNFGVQSMFILMIMLSGCFAAVMGTYTAVVDIINELRAK